MNDLLSSHTLPPDWKAYIHYEFSDIQVGYIEKPDLIQKSQFHPVIIQDENIIHAPIGFGVAYQGTVLFVNIDNEWEVDEYEKNT